jgi:hypothetical protein
MSAEWIQVSLRAWAAHRAVSTELLALFGNQVNGGHMWQGGESIGTAALARLVDVTMEQHARAAEPSEAFASSVEAALLEAAVWLQALPLEPFDECRRRGITMDVFIGSWIDQDQFDLNLPAPFILACGRLSLPISIVTND